MLNWLIARWKAKPPELSPDAPPAPVCPRCGGTWRLDRMSMHRSEYSGTVQRFFAWTCAKCGRGFEERESVDLPNWSP